MNDVAFQARLQSVLKDNKYDRFVTNKRSGKLDTKRVFKIAHSEKIFKKREERKGKHYSVLLLVDCSGSMSDGGKVRAASNAAIALQKHLIRAGVPIKIATFNAFYDVIKDWDDDAVDDKVITQEFYNKVGGSDNNKYQYVEEVNGKNEYVRGKDNPERYDEILRARGWSRGHHEGSRNCDGAYLRRAVNEIKKRKGGRILVVLSDGEPADLSSNYQVYGEEEKITYGEIKLKKEAVKAVREGIVFVSIGIKDSNVTNYYPPANTAVIRTDEELYPTVVNRLSRLIKRG